MIKRYRAIFEASINTVRGLQNTGRKLKCSLNAGVKCGTVLSYEFDYVVFLSDEITSK